MLLAIRSNARRPVPVDPASDAQVRSLRSSASAAKAVMPPLLSSRRAGMSPKSLVSIPRSPTGVHVPSKLASSSVQSGPVFPRPTANDPDVGTRTRTQASRVSSRETRASTPASSGSALQPVVTLSEEVVTSRRDALEFAGQVRTTVFFSCCSLLTLDL